MTDIQPYIPAAPEPTGKLALWVNDFKGVAEVAAAIARTRFCPESLYVWRIRDGRKDFDAEATTAQVASVIMTGQELGMSPMAALRSVDIIQGQPALRAIALRAVLLAQGHEIWVESATNNRATVVGRRRGSDHEQTISWSMDDAKSRGLAGKPNWKNQPRNMLVARATADVARLIAADALLGLPYIVEEMEDGAAGVDTIGATADQAPKSRRTRRPTTTTPAPDPEPTGPVDDPPLDETPAEPATEVRDEPPVDDVADEPPVDDEPATTDAGAGVEPVNPSQLRALHTVFTAKGFRDRDDRLEYVNAELGIQVETSKDLTKSQASRVIDALQRLTDVDEP